MRPFDCLTIKSARPLRTRRPFVIYYYRVPLRDGRDSPLVSQFFNTYGNLERCMIFKFIFTVIYFYIFKNLSSKVKFRAQ